jgi:hypothetical protein
MNYQHERIWDEVKGNCLKDRKVRNSSCPHHKDTSKPRDFTATQTCSVKTCEEWNFKKFQAVAGDGLLFRHCHRTRSQVALSCDHLRLSLSGSDYAVPCINLP